MSNNGKSATLVAKIQTAIEGQFYFNVTRDKKNLPTLAKTTLSILDGQKNFESNGTQVYFVKNRLAGEKDVVVEYMKKNGFSDEEIQDGLKYSLNASNYKTGQYKKLFDMDITNFQKIKDAAPAATTAAAPAPAKKAPAKKTAAKTTETAETAATEKPAAKKTATKKTGKTATKKSADKKTASKTAKKPAAKKTAKTESETSETGEAKRPLNAYQLWVKSIKKELKKEENAMATLKARWEQVKNSEEIKKFEKKAEQMKLQYRRKTREGMPKRPFSAYFLWSNEVRSKIKTENPTASIIELAKILGTKWNALTAGDRKKYEEEANRLKVDYQKKVEEYKKAHPETKKPRRPTSAFFFYLAEQRDRLTKSNPTMKITEISRLAKGEWDKLAASARGRYLQQALEDKKRYSREKEGRPTSPLRAEEVKGIASLEAKILEKIDAKISPRAAAPAPVATKIGGSKKK